MSSSNNIRQNRMATANDGCMNPVQRLLQESSSSVVLLQHGLCLSQRLVAAGASSCKNEEDIYKSAGLATPRKRASLDGCGSLLLLDVIQKTEKSVVFVQTLNNTNLWNDRHDHKGDTRMVCVDLYSDPMGWNHDDDDDDATDNVTTDNDTTIFQSRLDDLESAATTIESAVSVTKSPSAPKGGTKNTAACDGVLLVLESLTPILHMHGIHGTLSLLHRLKKLQCSMLLPLFIETISLPRHHRRLEDEVANVIVTLTDGQIRILNKHPHRSIGQVYSMDCTKNEYVLTFHSLPKLKTNDNGREEQQQRDAFRIEKKNGSFLKDAQNNKQQPRGSKKMIRLEHEIETDDTKQPSSTLDIYMEENDPEFHDLDEEDPDDDLDI